MRFDSAGDKFFMVFDEKISVHEAEDAKIVSELENPKRVLCAASGEVSLLGLSVFWLLFLGSFLFLNIGCCKFVMLDHIFG